MSLLGGLFGGKKHPNWDRVSKAIHEALGLTVTTPSDDVMQVIDAMTSRELVNFENAHSVEGMQELFRAKSIQAFVDPNLRTAALFLAQPEEIEKELKVEHTQVRVMHLAPHPVQAAVVKPETPRDPIQANRPAVAAAPLGPVAAGFEHLDALERLCPAIVDLFVRHGQLNTGDKDVLKKIKPADSTIEARVAALERWQAEVSRRLRALSVPKAVHHIAGAEGAANASKPADTVVRRFDSLIVWMSKLIKAFESTGVRFHNKPVWLPH